jgi:hypothetical protein
MTSPRRTGRDLGWLILFGIGFGFVEAAVVVYLRALYYPKGFSFPLVLPENHIMRVEAVREAATILMLFTVAMLARRAWARFAFCVVFGVWDIVYYLGLRAAIGWPEGLGTWDVLFLLPSPWLGPVWTAVLIAVSLVVAGAWIMHFSDRGGRPRVRWWVWAGALASLALLVGSFVGAGAGMSRAAAPGSFPFIPYVLGLILGWVIFYQAFGRSPQRFR